MPSASSSRGRRRVKRGMEAPRGVVPGAGASSRWENLVALGAALCLFLASVEYAIPKPLPFLRLGLSNLPLLVALDLLPLPQFLLLVALKILGQSVIQGSLFSVLFIFSLCGSLASALVMLGARRALGGAVSLVGVSVLGALASNLAQLALARYLVFGKAAWLIAPPFLGVGLVTSAVLGGLAELYRRRSAWLARVEGELRG
jgi:heptaprenyl diphosphate synthase